MTKEASKNAVESLPSVVDADEPLSLDVAGGRILDEPCDESSEFGQKCCLLGAPCIASYAHALPRRDQSLISATIEHVRRVGDQMPLKSDHCARCGALFNNLPRSATL
jgi:hypothetical protein